MKINVAEALLIGLAISALFVLLALMSYGDPTCMGSGDFFTKAGLIKFWGAPSFVKLLYVDILAIFYYSAINFIILPIVFVLPLIFVGKWEMAFEKWLGGILFIYGIVAVGMSALIWIAAHSI